MMGTKYPELFAALAAAFHPSDVKVRKYDGAKYVTARTVMNRLDDVLGPENWWAEPTPFDTFSVACRLTIRLPDGLTVTKSDVGAKSSMVEKQGGKCDPGEDDKGGSSDALKRSAVLFGVARYLYQDGVVTYLASDDEPVPEPAPRKLVAPEVAAASANPSRNGNGANGHHRAGRASKWGPTAAETAAAVATAQKPPAAPVNRDAETPPLVADTGDALYHWLKARDLEVPGFFQWCERYCASRELPVRMLGWDAATVVKVYPVFLRKFHKLTQDFPE